MLEMLASFYDAGQEMRTSKQETSTLKEVLCPTCPFCHMSLYMYHHGVLLLFLFPVLLLSFWFCHYYLFSQ
jgi:hypothetical protein